RLAHIGRVDIELRMSLPSEVAMIATYYWACLGLLASSSRTEGGRVNTVELAPVCNGKEPLAILAFLPSGDRSRQPQRPTRKALAFRDPHWLHPTLEHLDSLTLIGIYLLRLALRFRYDIQSRRLIPRSLRKGGSYAA